MYPRKREEASPPAFVRELFARGAMTRLQPSFEAGERRADLRRLWLRGGYPEPVLRLSARAAWRWFDSYVRTLSERDLSSISGALTPVAVARLLRMLAARHGQTVNVAQLARDFGANVRTIAGYLDALEGSFLWRRLAAYRANVGKRLTAAPRGYLVDSGLLHHMLDIVALDGLETHPARGASWEGWVIEQLWRQAVLMEPRPRFFYWRTQAGAEVDVVLEMGGKLAPVEIKYASEVKTMDLRGLRQFLSDFSAHAAAGFVIYRGDTVKRVEGNIWLVPVEIACLGA